MKVVLNVPASLQGQHAERIIDMFWLPRGTTPTGPLSSTVTLDASAEKSAHVAGLTTASYQYG